MRNVENPRHLDAVIGFETNNFWHDEIFSADLRVERVGEPHGGDADAGRIQVAWCAAIARVESESGIIVRDTHTPDEACRHAGKYYGLQRQRIEHACRESRVVVHVDDEILSALRVFRVEDVPALLVDRRL